MLNRTNLLTATADHLLMFPMSLEQTDNLFSAATSVETFKTYLKVFLFKKYFNV